MKQLMKKASSLFLALAMVLTGLVIVPKNVQAATVTKEVTISFSLADGTSAPNNFGVSWEYYAADGTTAKGINDDKRYNSSTMSQKITFEAEENEYVKIQIQSAGLTLLSGEADVTNEWDPGKMIKLSELADSYSFTLRDGGNGGSDPGPGPGQDEENPYQKKYGNHQETSTISITGEAEVFINGESAFDVDQNGNYIAKTSVTYPADKSTSDKIDISFNSLLNMRYTKVKINGVDYTSYIPGADTSKDLNTRKWEVLKATDGQFVTFTIPVDYAASYNIEVVKVVTGGQDDPDENANDVFFPAGNFLWSNDDRDKDTDEFMDHTIIQFVSFTYTNEAGQKVTINDIKDMNQEGYLQFDENENKGSAVLLAGGIITVKLVPAYGYQVVEFGPNGDTFETGADPCVYSFEIKSGNGHLGAKCAPVADVVEAKKADAISGGSIELADNELDMGTAVLSVADTNTSAKEDKKFADKAGSGYSVYDAFDISLDQVVYKGSEDECWTTDKDTLTGEATITLKVSGITGSSVEVIHQKHDGSYEKIPATYNAKKKTITFKTSSFSKFAIAQKIANGTEVTVSKNQYKILSTKNKTVSFIGTTSTAKTVKVPDSVKIDGKTYKVTTVAANALKKNTKVTKVTLGKNITSIGASAFLDCSELASLTIPANVKTIGAKAFSGDRKLITLTVSSGKLTKSGVKNALKGSGVKTVKLTGKAAKKQSSYKSYFVKKNSGRSVTIK